MAVETCARTDKKLKVVVFFLKAVEKMEEEEERVESEDPTGRQSPVLSPRPPRAPRSPVDEDEYLLGGDMHRYKPVNCCERYCCGGLQGMACGWPKGTVRAIIAVTLLLVVLGVEGFLVVWLVVHGNDTAAIGVGAGMLAELGAAFGFYFGARSSTPPKTEDTTHHTNDEEALDELEQQRRPRRRH